MIQHTNRIVDWYENLQSEEVPPQWMWPFEDELEIWFERVEEERKARFGGGSAGGDETVPMMQNELSKGRGR